MKKIILVIEDEHHISQLLKFILEKNGFGVLQCYNGRDGIECARMKNPSLIVLDVMMPNMDGFEVAKKLGSNNDTKSIPIIMLSSAAQFKDKVKGLESGAIDYILKPFDKNELIEKINKII